MTTDQSKPPIRTQTGEGPKEIPDNIAEAFLNRNINISLTIPITPNEEPDE